VGTVSPINSGHGNKRMAKIVHFGKFYYPDPGGIERVTVSLSCGATRYGHSVTVVCFKRSAAIREEVIDGVKVIRSPISKMLSSQPIGFNYFFECVRAAKNADIVHLHAPNILAALCTLFIRRKSRLLVHWHSDVINKGFLGELVRPLEFAMLRRAEKVIAASPVYANFSVAVAPFRRKIEVVPYGTASNTIDVDHSDFFHSILTKFEGRKLVLAVGRLVPYKGFEVLIKAAQELCDDSFVVIVGSGPLESEIKRLIVDAKLEERVILAGRLNDADLQALFERATIFCLPSIHRAEAFGVVMIEAMAHGVPIVASDIPGSGVPWVNEHGVSGLNVPIGNPIALARACNEILTSPELHYKLSQGARKRYIAEFTEEVSVNRMMAVYNRMLADPP
jgi:glycosyltransferase involved in cell wall biosynthesis